MFRKSTMFEFVHSRQSVTTDLEALKKHDVSDIAVAKCGWCKKLQIVLSICDATSGIQKRNTSEILMRTTTTCPGACQCVRESAFVFMCACLHVCSTERQTDRKTETETEKNPTKKRTTYSRRATINYCICCLQIHIYSIFELQYIHHHPLSLSHTSNIYKRGPPVAPFYKYSRYK